VGLVRTILVGLMFGAACAATAAERRYYFDNTADSNTGLVQHTVNGFFQDRTGFIWIATQGGLHKYDGYRIRVYEHAADDPDSLPSGFITAIAQDASDALWVGTRTAGIAKLDPASGKAQAFALPAAAPNAPWRNAIRALKFDPARGMWVVTEAGIELVDPASAQRRDVISFDAPPRAGGDAATLILDAEGGLWAATDQGLWRVAPHANSGQRIAAETIGAARGVVATRDGEIYVSTANGLFHVDAGKNRADPVWPGDNASGSASSRNAFDVIEDPQGKLWIAVPGEGLVVFDRISARSEWLREDRNVPGSLPEKFERHLFLDRSGLLWVGGMNRGFATTDPLGVKFRLVVDSDPNKPLSSTSNYVRALHEDALGRLWLAVEGAELKRYDPVHQAFDVFTEALVGAFGAGTTAADLRLTSIAGTDDGRLWVTTGRGVAVLDPAARTASRFTIPAPAGQPDWINSARVLLPARDGTLWLGSSTSGLAHGRPGGEDWEFLRHHDGDGESLVDDFVVSLYEDRSRRVWIGTIAGLSIYDPRTHTLHSYRHSVSDPTSLSDDIVHSVREGADGVIWVGTHNGLNRVEADPDGAIHFKRYLTRDGLANATIYSILDDDRGNLWLGTNRGIQWFDREHNLFHAFTLHDGLQGMEYNTDAALRLRNGDLAFAGTNGVNVFRPGSIRFTDFVPPIVITSMRVGDEAPATLSRQAEVVDVPQTRRVLRFEFAALDYAEPERNRFAYQLIGFDKAWVEAGTRPDATYTNLPVGNYTFRVRSSNRDGIWNEQRATLAVNITPPWWDSTPMRMLYAVLLTGILFVTWRSYQRRHDAELRHRDELQARDERFRMSLWGSRDEFWDLDVRTGTLHRMGVDRSFGGRFEETISDEVWLTERVHPDDVSSLLDRRRAHIEGHADVIESEHRVRDSNGEWVWRLSRGQIVERDADGKPLRVCGTARNVTQTRLAERQQRIAAEVLNSMNEAVGVTDLEFNFTSVNQAFERISGYSEVEVAARSIQLLHSPRQATDSYRHMRDDYIAHGHWHGEVWIRRKSGEDVLCWLEVSAVHDAAGRRTHYVSVMTDITERKRAEQDLRYLANYDPLTGLPNRSLFIERLVAAIDRATHEETRVAVLFLDLDHFKHVNDSMGHSCGDLLLRVVGERLRAALRENDTVARLGGDEFTILVEGLRTQTEAERLAQKVIDALATPLDVEGARELVVTPSIGISLFPDHARGPMNLLKFADTAMYQAKEQGRNTYAVYTQAMDVNARRWADMAAALRRAIDSGELEVVYQPKLSLHKQRIGGVEALLRWHSREFGEISPAQFIPLAEQIGLIVEIGDYVLRTACAQLKAWRDLGLTGISMAVNISVLQLLRGELAARLRRILTEHAIEPGLVQLELTESMLMARAEQALNTLAELKGLGVSLAIDDFGTGYSSLSYLKRLPIDTLKIDRSFVRDISTDPDDKAITATIIHMAHSLQKTVVAEGVETVEQFEYLRDQGCDEVQGNWLSVPLSAEPCTALLRDNSNRPALKLVHAANP